MLSGDAAPQRTGSVHVKARPLPHMRNVDPQHREALTYHDRVRCESQDDLERVLCRSDRVRRSVEGYQGIPGRTRMDTVHLIGADKGKGLVLNVD